LGVANPLRASELALFQALNAAILEDLKQKPGFQGPKKNNVLENSVNGIQIPDFRESVNVQFQIFQESVSSSCSFHHLNVLKLIRGWWSYGELRQFEKKQLLALLSKGFPSPKCCSLYLKSK